MIVFLWICIDSFILEFFEEVWKTDQGTGLMILFATICWVWTHIRILNRARPINAKKLPLVIGNTFHEYQYYFYKYLVIKMMIWENQIESVIRLTKKVIIKRWVINIRTYQFLFDFMYSVAILFSMALPSFEITLDFSFKTSPLVSFETILFFSNCWRAHLITLVPAVWCLGGLLWDLILPP